MKIDITPEEYSAYMEKTGREIAALVRSEARNATTAGERDLFYLYENRKHTKALIAEMGGGDLMLAMHATTSNPYPHDTAMGY